MNNIAKFFIPCSSKKEAQTIAELLLQKKIIACANIVAASSMYVWKGAIEKADEHMLIATSSCEKKDAVTDCVQQHHSYEIPGISVVRIEVNEAYQTWVEASLSP